MKRLSLRSLTPTHCRLVLKTIAWGFENALVALGAVLAAPLLYRGFDMGDGLLSVKNFIDHIIWRENKDALIEGIWLALIGLFVATCILRLPAWFSMRSAEKARAS
ncbi:MAG: hypothetical protein AAGJ51_11665 [Pseudomonadota bacterium]